MGRSRRVRLAVVLAAGLAGTGLSQVALARAPLTSEPFTGATVSSTTWVTGSPYGSDYPCLTAAAKSVAGSIPACHEVVAGTKKADPVGSGAFRLTDNSPQNAASLLLNQPINAKRGVTFEFDMYMYDSKPTTDPYGTWGADGISFYLVDGTQTKVNPGEPGGALGYKKLSGAFAGVGFDQFGNFSTSIGGAGAKPRTPNSVVIRGGQSTGYTYVAGAKLDPAAQRLGLEKAMARTQAKRHVVIDVAPSGMMDVSINFEDGKGLQQVISTDLNKLPGQGSLPDSVKIGWASSSGNSTSVHEISGFQARTLDADLTVRAGSDGPWKPGGTGNYNLNVDVSPNYGWSDDPVTVTHTLPAGVTATAATGDGWTCTIAGQAVTCKSSKTVQPGQSYPPINVAVKVGDQVSGSVDAVTQVEIPSTVPGGIEVDTTNNTAHTMTDVQRAAPDVSVSLESDGPAHQGGPAGLTATVSNAATAGPTAGPTTVTIPAPDGTTIATAAGDGWTCKVTDSKTAACTRSDVLQPGASFPPIKVGLTVSPTATAGKTPATATADTAGDTNPGNNTGRTDLEIKPATPDLAVQVSGTAGCPTGCGTGRIQAEVSNVGSGPTTGTVTVTIPVPAGITITGTSGAGWDCTTAAQQITCTRPGTGGDALQPGAAYPAITTTTVAPEVVAIAKVTTASDDNTINNTAQQILGPTTTQTRTDRIR